MVSILIKDSAIYSVTDGVKFILNASYDFKDEKELDLKRFNETQRFFSKCIPENIKMSMSLYEVDILFLDEEDSKLIGKGGEYS